RPHRCPWRTGGYMPSFDKRLAKLEAQEREWAIDTIAAPLALELGESFASTRAQLADRCAWVEARYAALGDWAAAYAAFAHDFGVTVDALRAQAQPWREVLEHAC